MRFGDCSERFLQVSIFTYFHDPNVSPNTSCGGLHLAPSRVSIIEVGSKQVADNLTSWDNLVYKLQTLGFEVRAENGHAGDVATRVIEAGNIPKLYRIAAERNDDRNCFGRSDRGSVGATCPDQDIWPKA